LSKDRSNSTSNRMIEHKIFLPSLIILIAISIPLVLFQEQSMNFLNGVFNQIASSFQWGYIWYAIILTAAGFYLAFSKYGKVVLGDPAEKPRFNFFEYASIIVAMGLGSTIMRTAMIQWMEVGNNPPIGVEPQSLEALMWGNSYSMYIWGFQSFAIFVMAAPALGYILHVRRKPHMRISEACRIIFGDKFTDGLGGIVLDVIFMVSIIAGAAVTLGLGAPIVTVNLAELLNIEQSFLLTLIVTVVWVFLFTISAYLGIERGIKKLSTFNMYLAAAFAIFVMLIGPGMFIMNYFTESFGFLLSNYADMTLYTNSLSEGTTHIEEHKVFWFAYNATWAMLHSVFAAKVSRGRTIKEMILTYFFAPMLFSWAATAVLGGLGTHRQITGQVDSLGIAQNDAMAAIPQILSSLPLAPIVLIVFIIIALIFMTTTLDSTTYSIAAYTGTKNMSKAEPSRALRIMIAVMITVFSLILMWIGGLEPLEVVTGILGIPIIVIQLLLVYAAIKMIKQDRAWIYNVREKDKPRRQSESSNKRNRRG